MLIVAIVAVVAPIAIAVAVSVPTAPDCGLEGSKRLQTVALKALGAQGWIYKVARHGPPFRTEGFSLEP